MTNKRKVLIIGLDGFTWSLGERFLQEGVMPNLARLVAQGSHGILQSVIPFTTAPAWSAFMTGVRPGKTAVYSFHGYDRQKKQIYLNSFSNIAVPSLWELADQAGKTVVSLNMPVTSPPPKIKGAIIPGLLCAGLSPETTNPPELYTKYIEPEKDYHIVNTKPVETVSDFVDQQIATEQTRSRVGLRLMDDYDWDLFSYQMQSTDRLQHHLWSALDEKAPAHTSENRNEALRFYRACDDVIGQLLEKAGPDVLTVIASDHGFARLEHSFFLNVWLKQKGYLHLKPIPQSKAKRTKEALKNAIPPLKWLAKAYGKLNPHDKTYSEEKFLAYLQQVLDMDRTSAFSVGSMSGLIYLNGNQEERKQLTEKLTSELMAEFGPNSELKLVTKVEAGPQTFNQPQDDRMPDVVVHYREGVFGQLGPQSDVVVTQPSPDSNPMDLLGTHSQAGVFVMQGPNVIPNKTFNAEIVDLIPTILAYLGVPVPKHTDGRALTQAFTTFPEVTYTDATGRQSQVTEYSDQEQADIEKRLSDLGYM